MNIKVIVLSLITALTLNGCATSSEGYDYSKVDPSIAQDDVNFFSKSGYQSCLIGAAAGVAACLMSNSSNKLACAAIAAVGGCAVLMGANYVLDDVRTKYKQKEEQLAAMKDYVVKDKDRLQGLNKRTKELIAKDKKEIAAIQKDIKKGTRDSSELSAKLESIDNNIAYLEKTKESYEHQLTVYKEANEKFMYDPSNNQIALSKKEAKAEKKLKDEIAQLEKQIAELKTHLVAYSKQRSALTGA